jgi:hypothetical protein
MSQPEGPTYKALRRMGHKYIRNMSQELKDDIMSRAPQIEKKTEYDEETIKEVYLNLGCTNDEASFLKDKRLDSPGVRQFLRTRCIAVKEAIQIQQRYEYEMNQVIEYFRRKIAHDPRNRNLYKEQGDDNLNELKTRMDDEMEMLIFGGGLV